KYNAADPFSPGGEAPAKAIPFSVNGTLAIAPTPDGPKIGGEVTTFPALETYGQRPGMDTQTLLQSWPSFDDGQFGPINGLLFHKTVGDYGVVSSFNDITPQMPIPQVPHLGPGSHPPVIPAAPPMNVLPPANLTPLGPVSAPPSVIVRDPTMILPQPPLR
ncbi:MAG: EspA/EspE family type VII secretion system effector, partial [Ilumatobacteraceae bacterium]